jgi:hypothetical protein
MYIHVIPFTHTQDTTNQEAPIHTPKQERTEVTDIADDTTNDDSDEDREFTDDEDDFIMMTPTATLSQKIATESAATKVSFMCSMLNMLGDRLRNVPKNY